VLILDSGGVSFLGGRHEDAVASIRVFVRDGLWPPLVPSVVLAETTTGRQQDDANANRLLKTCDLVEQLPASVARRAGELRHKARRGSAVDAILVATAEPGGTVLTGDVDDLEALASHANRVTIQRVRPLRQ
jgi:predicted nucleic acid-binding protein